MKYLTDYTEQLQTELFDKLGVFFAFSEAQLKEKRIRCVHYVSMGSGMVAPKVNAQAVMDGLSSINQAGILLDIAENGKEDIIKRELNNYECYYTGDCTEVIEALKGYDIPTALIVDIYQKECRNPLNFD